MPQSLLRLAAVGDLQLGDSPTCVGFGFASRYTPADLPNVLANVAPAWQGAHLVFGNLETPLSLGGVLADSLQSRQLRGDPGFAAALARIGFTVLNVANNHAVQHGAAAFHDTVDALRQSGIAVCGLRGDPPWASQPAIVMAGGHRMGILGYCLRPRQYSSDTPPHAEGSPESMRADIERLRVGTDMVVVSMHWGEEFVPQPSVDEVTLAHALVDAGASVVLGHHPHVVRPVERYRGGVIAYSMGNLVGDMVWYEPFRTGTILQLTVDDGCVRDIQTQPTTLGRDYRPRLLGSGVAVTLEGPPQALGAEAYADAIRTTWRRQRLAAYWYTVSRSWRFPPRILVQLVVQTVRNKLAGLRASRLPDHGLD